MKKESKIYIGLGWFFYTGSLFPGNVAVSLGCHPLTLWVMALINLIFLKHLVFDEWEYLKKYVE